MSPVAFLTTHHPDSPRALATSYLFGRLPPSRLPLDAGGPHTLPCLYSLLTLKALVGNLIHSLDNCVDELMNSKSFMSQNLNLYIELPNGHLLLDRPQAPQTQHLLN